MAARSRSPQPYRITFRQSQREDFSAAAALMNNAAAAAAAPIPLANVNNAAAAAAAPIPLASVGNAAAPMLANVPMRNVQRIYANEYGWTSDLPWDSPLFNDGPPAVGRYDRLWDLIHPTHWKRSYRSVSMCILCGCYVQSHMTNQMSSACSGDRAQSGRNNLVRLRQGVYPRSGADFAA